MWPSGGDTEPVCCIACGAEVDREDAREYDKHGDRWDREGKSFEYLCKDCYADLTKVHHTGLEGVLVDAGAGRVSREEFLTRYLDAAESPDDER